MRAAFTFLFATLLASAVAERLSGIPTVPFVSTGDSTVDGSSINRIVVHSSYANEKDTNGATLIPPTLQEFADTFAEDLATLVGREIPVEVGTESASDAIFLTLGNQSAFLDAAGRPTSEGYSLDIGGAGSNDGVTITGASPLGVWWGTRTILQQLVLGDGKLHTGSSTDSPGWATRGIMLDTGRHYYPPEFLVELCAYLSFFKQNTFHLHLSDNLYNNVGIYSRERSLSLYAAFRLLSDDPAVAGLNRRLNESYTREDFDYIQQKCVSRGVTIVPEIEAPGHALVITQWKPEIGIDGDLSLLNISNPETIPTMQTIWKTFLPWFQSKVVHIGADEYVDESLSEDALAGEYTHFVNAMNDFIQTTSGKTIRIWGTFPPKANTTNVNTTVSVQHWQFFEDNPYYDFIQNGYEVLNSDDAVYIVGKWSGSYPQQLNLTRIFYGAPGGGPLSPHIFDTKNSTNNPPRDHPSVLGHVAPLWNDFGPNSTVYSEAYYSWRNGLPALADKQWGGELLEEEYNRIFDVLHSAIPGQNLDRTIPSDGSTIVHYDFSNGIEDISGNGYHATTDCSVGDSVQLASQCSVRTPLNSKGRNYTLSFSIKPISSARGPILTGSDSELWFGNGPSNSVMLVSGGNAFALNYTFPVGEWTEASLIGRGSQTFLGLGNGTELEFITKIGINGARFVWAPIAVEAPLSRIGGGQFEGEIGYLKLIK